MQKSCACDNEKTTSEIQLQKQMTQLRRGALVYKVYKVYEVYKVYKAMRIESSCHVCMLACPPLRLCLDFSA